MSGIRGILISLTILSILAFHPSTSKAWREEQHKLMLSDAIDYMENSGNELMMFIVDWLKWAPGYNYTRGALQAHEWAKDLRCKKDSPEWPGYYSAFCALGDEAANTDWYADMKYYVKDREQAWIVCSSIVLAPLCVPCWAACAMVTGFEESSSNYYHDGESFNMTSFNHFVGAYYDSDQVPRSPGCPLQPRDDMENFRILIQEP